MLDPFGHELIVGSGAESLAHLVHDRHRGVDDQPVALVEHQQGARRAVAAATACRFGGVVEAQHGRGGAAPEDLPARLEAVGERGEVIRRPALGGRNRVGPQPHPGDHAERALGADEQLGQIGPDRGRGGAAGADHPAVGEHDLEADHHVLDLAVAGRVLAGAAAGDPAADRGELEALREVADGEPVVGC